MPDLSPPVRRALRRYAFLVAVRTLTFYVAFALVQLMFDGKVMWLPNLGPAVAIAVLMSYVQARLSYLKKRMERR